VHGSPVHEDEYLVSAEDAVLAFQAARARITFFGHTHMQVGFASDGDGVFTMEPLYSSDHEPDEYELPLRRGFNYLLNPGSLGQPRDGDWRAAFAVYDEERALFTWHRAPYDVSKTQEKIRAAGLPDILAIRLRAGR
jgi:diadenosine tetraphosphatase ApaH/serine/threonine PP2A family protein phosphatase